MKNSEINNNQEIVPEEIYKQRLDVCRRCAFKSPMPKSYVCLKCGCNMAEDAAVKAKECPEHYWTAQ